MFGWLGGLVEGKFVSIFSMGSPKIFFPWKKLEAKTPVNKMMKKTMNIYISFSSLTSSLLIFSFYVIPMTYLVMTLKTGMVK